VAPLIRQIIRELDPELPVPTPRTMNDIVNESVAVRRFQMNLMLLLASAALLLAALGIYGVVSQSVVQRISEFGIRMALGADRKAILVLVVRRAMVPVAAGLIVGIVASVGAGRLLRTLLFGVSPTDIGPFVVSSAFLVAVALIASLLPARGATRLDPAAALRIE
jgi:ABC-type antimicrobial peptide transport system permease subunit